MILGHGHRYVVEAVKKAATRGFSFGAPTLGEIELAEMIAQAVPSIEMLRLVNSGTEATMSALRLARAATGRSKVLKFDGGYHGHVDSLLVRAGSAARRSMSPTPRGVPPEVAKLTLIARYNDLEDVRAQVKEHASDLAAIIVEPVAGNMGCVPPLPGFLEGLRTICDEHGALLIFDEVMTGFRVAYGGAQTRFGVRPDITTLGKIIGGGMPIGAYGASREIMQLVSPSARCTRPARCPAIRWRWRRDARPCRYCATRRSMTISKSAAASSRSACAPPPKNTTCRSP